MRLGATQPQRAASVCDELSLLISHNSPAPYCFTSQRIACGTTVNRLVAGSNPARGAKFFKALCVISEQRKKRKIERGHATDMGCRQPPRRISPPSYRPRGLQAARSNHASLLCRQGAYSAGEQAIRPTRAAASIVACKRRDMADLPCWGECRCRPRRPARPRSQTLRCLNRRLQHSPCCWPNGTKIPAAACTRSRRRRRRIGFIRSARPLNRQELRSGATCPGLFHVSRSAHDSKFAWKLARIAQEQLNEFVGEFVAEGQGPLSSIWHSPLRMSAPRSRTAWATRNDPPHARRRLRASPCGAGPGPGLRISCSPRTRP